MMESSIDFYNPSGMNVYISVVCVVVVVTLLVYVLFSPKGANALSSNTSLISIGIAAVAFLFADYWTAAVLIVLLIAVLIKKQKKKSMTSPLPLIPSPSPIPKMKMDSDPLPKIKQAMKMPMLVTSEEADEVSCSENMEKLSYDTIQSNLVNPSNIMTEVRTFDQQLGPQGLSSPHGYDEYVQDSL